MLWLAAELPNRAAAAGSVARLVKADWLWQSADLLGFSAGMLASSCSGLAAWNPCSEALRTTGRNTGLRGALPFALPSPPSTFSLLSPAVVV